MIRPSSRIEKAALSLHCEPRLFLSAFLSFATAWCLLKSSEETTASFDSSAAIDVRVKSKSASFPTRSRPSPLSCSAKGLQTSSSRRETATLRAPRSIRRPTCPRESRHSLERSTARHRRLRRRRRRLALFSRRASRRDRGASCSTCCSASLALPKRAASLPASRSGVCRPS